MQLDLVQLPLCMQQELPLLCVSAQESNWNFFKRRKKISVGIRKYVSPEKENLNGYESLKI